MCEIERESKAKQENSRTTPYNGQWPMNRQPSTSQGHNHCSPTACSPVSETAAVRATAAWGFSNRQPLKLLYAPQKETELASETAVVAEAEAAAQHHNRHVMPIDGSARQIHQPAVLRQRPHEERRLHSDPFTGGILRASSRAQQVMKAMAIQHKCILTGIYF